MKRFNSKILSILLTTCLSTVAYACTDFNLIAKDGSIIVARTLEFAQDLNSNLRSSTRDREFKTNINGMPALTWKAKYGYVYLDGLDFDMAADGMNEKGLSFEALYLPNLAEYQAATSDKTKDSLPYYHIGDWILSNFATVDEVKKALPEILVVEAKIPGQGNTILPLHFAMYDATGKSIVVEYVAGKLNIYDNKIGVMTNCPEYFWHVTNLNNYVNLNPTNPKPVVVKGLTFVATGQGNGMLGLPGDISPPSRFVKMSVFKAVVQPTADGPSTVNLAEHMINNVDIPFGLARAPVNDNYTSEYTQWTVFKDLTNMKFYYKTYYDPSLHMVDMTKVSFDAKAPTLKMPIMTKTEYVNDLTATFKQSSGS